MTVLLSSLPHLFTISPLMSASCLLSWAYYHLARTGILPLPGLALRTLAGSALFVAAVSLHEGLTVDAFVALLISMLALKLFELRSRRDLVVTVILCYFVIISGMFFSDSLLATSYILFSVIFNTAVLIHTQFPQTTITRALGVAGRLTLQALPFMLVLFLFFPRIQGGLWGRSPTVSSQTGFSEEVSLGGVARLAQNPKVAFRVAFTDAIPQQQELYWRGIVFWELQGSTWQRGSPGFGFMTQPRDAAQETVKYAVTLEPHQQRWLFTLDLPTAAPRIRRTWLLADHTLYSWRPITNRLSYEAVSSIDARATVGGRQAALGLQLPSAGNPRARSLAAQWRNEDPSAAAVIAKALQFFQTEGFRYTLEPGAGGTAGTDDAIDAFLFESRRGFCEHFASSFAFLMRAANIPARLVGGYLGGSRNPYGDYLVVRQSDAHVWCEVLVNGDQWLRVDPTLAVAPERSHTAIADMLAGGLGASPLAFLGIQGLPGWLRQVGDAWDLVNSRWNQWVMDYSFADQVSLFSRFGIDPRVSRGMVQAGIIGSIALAAAVFLSLALLRGRAGHRDPVTRHWIIFNAKMTRAGFERKPHQGPVDYLDALGRERPDLHDSARRIIDEYIALRYGGSDDPAKLAEFARAVRTFSPGKTASGTGKNPAPK